jgi:hypothetical protein
MSTIGQLTEAAERRRDQLRAAGKFAAAERAYARDLAEIRRLRRRVVAAVVRDQLRAKVEQLP